MLFTVFRNRLLLETVATAALFPVMPSLSTPTGVFVVVFQSSPVDGFTENIFHDDVITRDKNVKL